MTVTAEGEVHGLTTDIAGETEVPTRQTSPDFPIFLELPLPRYTLAFSFTAPPS